MHEFKTPSGAIVKVNDTSFAAAIALGWEQVKPEEQPKRRAKKAVTE